MLAVVSWSLFSRQHQPQHLLLVTLDVTRIIAAAILHTAPKSMATQLQAAWLHANSTSTSLYRMVGGALA